MSLTAYNKKRDFKQTAEPKGKASTEGKLRFVVQRHHASHIHYDFRLELNGVLLSWAVPKGPSLNPAIKRLAMHVEDHPVSYIGFEGTIPKGNYGAGSVEVWDHGTYQPEDGEGNAITAKQAITNYKKGSLKFILKGKKLKGSFALVNLKKDDGKSWLLIKHRDAYAVNEDYNAEDFSRNRKKEDAKSDQLPTGPKKARSKKDTSTAVKKKPGIRGTANESNMPNSPKKVGNYIRPMLASVADEAFDDRDWIYELKLDGYRAIAELDGHIKLYSRNGLSFIDKYPAIVQALQKIKQAVVLDGEIVLLDHNGKPNFQKLQHYEDNMDASLVYYVFDLLMLDGEDTKGFPLTDRKKLLKQLLGNNSTIKYCDHIETKGKAFYKKAIAAGMEGIMAKRKDSSYIMGTRTKDWLKIKNTQTHEAIIVGYTEPRGSRKHFGALVLAKYAGNKLQYIGHTGTGFNGKTLQELWQSMQPLKSGYSPFATPIKTNAAVTWLQPRLVAELGYTELTRDNIMRHPVFIRLRPDKDAKEIIMQSNNKTARATKKKPAMEEPANTLTNEREEVIEKRKLQFTNLDKVFWPKEQYTKGDVIDYYNTMATYILPYLKGRPLSLKRNPNGISDEGFFHKDAGDAAPSWVKKAPIHSESANKVIHYIVCNDRPTLLYLANLGCIEMNPWNSTVRNIQKPSYIVVDIDPSVKNSFDQVIETALMVKEIMDKAGGHCYCKTSGASGMHVYIPLGNRYDYEIAKDFAHIIASLVQEQLPHFTTLERSLDKRGNRIYVDYLQNRTGQTLAAAYSLRPREGATVSTPLEWKEVKTGLLPSAFNLHSILRRVQKKGDLFAPVLGKGIDIKKCLSNLHQ